MEMELELESETGRLYQRMEEFLGPGSLGETWGQVYARQMEEEDSMLLARVKQREARRAREREEGGGRIRQEGGRVWEEERGKERVRREEMAGKRGVMYISLDGGKFSYHAP